MFHLFCFTFSAKLVSEQLWWTQPNLYLSSVRQYFANSLLYFVLLLFERYTCHKKCQFQLRPKTSFGEVSFDYHLMFYFE